MKLSTFSPRGIDFTGIAILGGAAIVVFLGYKIYTSTVGLVGDVKKKAAEIGQAIADASPIPLSAADAKNVYDNTDGALDVKIDPVTKAVAPDPYHQYAEDNPGAGTDSGANFSYF
jgi:hypothetical protein